MAPSLSRGSNGKQRGSLLAKPTPHHTQWEKNCTPDSTPPHRQYVLDEADCDVWQTSHPTHQAGHPRIPGPGTGCLPCLPTHDCRKKCAVRLGYLFTEGILTAPPTHTVGSTALLATPSSHHSLPHSAGQVHAPGSCSVKRRHADRKSTAAPQNTHTSLGVRGNKRTTHLPTQLAGHSRSCTSQDAVHGPQQCRGPDVLRARVGLAGRLLRALP